ncbi:MAG TPA: cytochrome ubiquinol oxidase subunit I [Gammaproteobacteria bacterium]|nr:cytochrome ubiquinol oxidase subunit I [Gammaproteobacteria bacterium]
MTTELLSRLQFAFTISYHILFPTLTIGLSVFLVIFEALWLKTGNPRWLAQCKFWAKPFALSFGMGVVTGIVLSYEFGTNFAPFSRTAGNIVGPLLTYEVLSAFFLEAGFLGIMLFGWNRVGKKLHFAATTMVAVGTFFSAFWVISANSWMQTPAGFILRDGVFYPGNWLEIIFNPSFVYRLTHMLLACLLSACFFVAGISAWFLLKKREYDFKWVLRWALGLAAVLVPLQILVGDLSGLQVLKYQPIKAAAIEANWETQSHAPLLLFAIPDMEAETNHYEIGIPNGASWILTHDAAGVVPGLKSVPPEDRPNVALVFWSFRVMVGIGLLMLFIAWYGMWLQWRKRLVNTQWFLRLCVIAIPSGFIAVVAGWWVAEVGRQPWVIYGLMRTSEAVSSISSGQVLSSFLAFIGIYSVMFVAYIYYLCKIIRKGPDTQPPDSTLGSAPSSRPVAEDKIANKRQ